MLFDNLLNMKTTLKRQLLLIAIVLFGSGSFAQSYTINNIADSAGFTNNCDSIATLDFWSNGWGWNQQADNFYNITTTGMVPGDQMIITVSWGDGTVNTYTGVYQAPTLPLVLQGSVQHNYGGIPGTFPISVTVLNPLNNSTFTHTGYSYISSCPFNFFGILNIDCDSNGVIDSTLTSGVDMILTGNGTIYPFTTGTMSSIVSNLPTGNYTITIDPTWLALNNYQLFSITPSSFFYQPGSNNTLTILATVFCDTLSPSNDGCASGYVFCDVNNNGIYDTWETVVPNAPVTVTYNNQSLLVYTNLYGLYNIYAPNGSQNTAVISVDANWLAQNGYQFTSNSASITLQPCQVFPPAPYVNFPLNCDSVQVATECIYGWVFCDANGNGSFDAGEVPIANAPININGNSNFPFTIYSDSNGVYSYSGQAIFNGFAILSIPTWWLTQHGYTLSNSIITVQTDCNNPTPVYFGVNCSPTLCADLWTTVNPWIGYFQNSNNHIKLKWGNNGPSSTTGYTLTLTYPSSVTPNLSSIDNSNYVISGNTITWTFGPGSSYINQQDIISFFVPSGYPSGTPHLYTSTITALGSTTDCDLLNNDGSLCLILGNSYDPNDKSTSLTPIIDPTVQDELTYVIRFQNTGTAPAQDVYIIDSLSSNLDWSTLKVISASHNMQLINLGNGIMKFNFPGIWLPDSTANEPASHGDVVFSIKENVGNGIGSVIENTGYIYFDWNPAIITNTVVNENNVLGLDESVNEVGISPNPFTGTIKVESVKKIDLIKVLDLAGKVIFETVVNDFNAQLELSQLTQGIYFVKVMSGTEVSTSKVVKY